MASPAQVYGGNWDTIPACPAGGVRAGGLEKTFPLWVGVCEYPRGEQARTGREAGVLEIFCVVSGAGLYRIGGESIPFEAGDILLVQGQGGHGVEEFQGGVRRAVEIVFLPELLAGPGAMECDLWLLRLFCGHGDGVARLGAGDAVAGTAWGWVKELAARERGAGDDPWSRARRKHSLCGLLLALAEALPERMRSACDGEAKRSRVRRLEPLFDHLAEHLREHVGVGEAAGIVRMSESYFTRFFRAAMGMNYSAYVEELRVNRAYELLMGEGGMSLAEIAEEAGFCDQCHLSRHFRRRFGASPGRVRARERERRLAGGGGGGERGFEPPEHG